MLELGAEILAETRVAPGQLEEVVLIGGTSFVPLLREKVKEQFGLEPSVRSDPHHAVVRGGATMLQQKVEEANNGKPIVQNVGRLPSSTTFSPGSLSA